MEENIFKNHKICVFGIQGSGKTFFVENWLMKKFRNPVVYLMHEEDFENQVNGTKIIVPRDDEGNVDTSMKTLNNTSKEIRKLAKEGKVDCFIIDEADLFIPKDFRSLQKFPAFQDLVINHRHYGLSLIFITRRPQELPTAITEQSAHYFCFAIYGKNVREWLNSIYDKFGDYSMKLNKTEHKFLHLEPGAPKPLSKYSKISALERDISISK